MNDAPDEKLRAKGARRRSVSAWPSASPLAHRQETFAAVALTAVVVLFHVLRAIKAGALWRDEAAAVAVATLPSMRDVFHNFQYEAFPLVFPTTLRVYTWIAGTSDLALRMLGMFVGISIVGALWLNMQTFRRGVPLLSLALLGFNAAFIQWADSVRGYGLGTLFMLLTPALLWRAVDKPTPGRMALALVSAVCTVQCLFNNATLLFATCLGVMTITFRRNAVRSTWFVLSCGIAAMSSLFIYWSPLHRARDWDILVRGQPSFGDLCSKWETLLSASGSWNAWIWMILLVAGLAIAFYGQLRRRSVLRLQTAQREVLLFCGVALAVGVTGYYTFLKILNYPTQMWYYLPLTGFSALVLDLVFDTLRSDSRMRIARLSLALLIAVGSLPLAWHGLNVRQTNMDLLARKLAQSVDPDDLIIVAPWYDGISFQRYYTGPAPWLTIPPIDFHRFHRYDLIKSQIILPDQSAPIRPVLDRIDETLKRGRRVWFASTYLFGSATPPEAALTLSPAPTEKWGWNADPYVIVWSAKTIAYLHARAQHAENVPIPVTQPVNSFENLTLTLFADSPSSPSRK